MYLKNIMPPSVLLSTFNKPHSFSHTPKVMAAWLFLNLWLFLFFSSRVPPIALHLSSKALPLVKSCPPGSKKPRI